MNRHLALLLLAACGGGGGGSQFTPSTNVAESHAWMAGRYIITDEPRPTIDYAKISIGLPQLGQPQDRFSVWVDRFNACYSGPVAGTAQASGNEIRIQFADATARFTFSDGDRATGYLACPSETLNNVLMIREPLPLRGLATYDSPELFIRFEWR